MRKKQKHTSDYGITLAGRQLKEFNRRYKKELYNKSSRCSRALTLAASLGMAGISAWLLAANVSDTLVMTMLLLPPAAVGAISVLSLLEKSEEIKNQLLSAAAAAMLAVLLNSLIFTRSGEDLPLYMIFTVIALVGVLAGASMWGRRWMNALSAERQRSEKPDYALVSLIAVSVVPVVRTVMAAIDGHAGMRFIILVIVMVPMFALLGYVIGMAVGNIRYMRYLERKNGN